VHKGLLACLMCMSFGDLYCCWQDKRVLSGRLHYIARVYKVGGPESGQWARIQVGYNLEDNLNRLQMTSHDTSTDMCSVSCLDLHSKPSVVALLPSQVGPQVDEFSDRLAPLAIGSLVGEDPWSTLIVTYKLGKPLQININMVSSAQHYYTCNIYPLIN
jgi:hypothetical protein